MELKIKDSDNKSLGAVLGLTPGRIEELNTKTDELCNDKIADDLQAIAGWCESLEEFAYGVAVHIYHISSLGGIEEA